MSISADNVCVFVVCLIIFLTIYFFLNNLGSSPLSSPSPSPSPPSPPSPSPSPSSSTIDENSGKDNDSAQIVDIFEQTLLISSSTTDIDLVKLSTDQAKQSLEAGIASALEIKSSRVRVTEEKKYKHRRRLSNHLSNHHPKRLLGDNNDGVQLTYQVNFLNDNSDDSKSIKETMTNAVDDFENVINRRVMVQVAEILSIIMEELTVKAKAIPSMLKTSEADLDAADRATTTTAAPFPPCDATGEILGATGVGDCTRTLLAGASCTQYMQCGTCSVSSCATSGATLAITGTCTLNELTSCNATYLASSGTNVGDCTYNMVPGTSCNQVMTGGACTATTCSNDGCNQVTFGVCTSNSCDASTLLDGATGVGDCTSTLSAGASCMQVMNGGTCTPSICGDAGTTLQVKFLL